MPRFIKKILTTFSIMAITGSSFTAGVAYGLKTNVTNQITKALPHTLVTTVKDSVAQLQKKLPKS